MIVRCSELVVHSSVAGIWSVLLRRQLIRLMSYLPSNATIPE